MTRSSSADVRDPREPVLQRGASGGVPLRVGLIGCGKMGIQHLRAMSGAGGAVVVGIADPAADPEQLAGVLPEARLYPTARALFQEARPDVVHIVTPPSTHVGFAVQAIEAGCHIYVEKPFAPTRLEASEVLALASRRGVQVCAGHQYLFERPALLALDALPRIGRLVHVDSYFSFRMVRRTITPGDQVRDILPHAVYPLLQQMRAGTQLTDAPFEVAGMSLSPDGDLYALLRLGDCTGILTVSLSGRPVEQYQHLVGTNGWLRADYVTGSLTLLSGPGTGPGILFTPYRRAFQTLTGATSGFARLLRRRSSYPGLETLVQRFYASIATGGAPPIAPHAILDTVDICERIGDALAGVESRSERAARTRVAEAELRLPPADRSVPLTLVTGGSGLLGRRVAEELRHSGVRVRVLSRRVPAWSARLPGVEYVPGDLAQALDDGVMRGVSVVVHCAAETAGGKQDHARNSIAASRHALEAAARAGVTSFVHVSSLAVLRPGSSAARPLDERSPVDAANLERGPYVWGKAESEGLVRRLGSELGVSVKIVRPGPLVDYANFHPPGRLGREVGPWFIAVGGRSSSLSVCDVGTAARVLRSYVHDFDAAPPLVNLVEAPPPTRGELVARLIAGRPDLRVVWVPALLLKLLAGPLKLAQRVLLHSDKPIDVYSAFASEHYRIDVASAAIKVAGPSLIDVGESDVVTA